jgi:hypothetical protein
MADLYSDHYNSVASSSSIGNPRTKVAPGIFHSTIRYKRGVCTVTTDTAAADVLRFFTLKPSDRLIHLRLSHTADASTSATGNCGLHLANGGAVVDINLFCAVGTSPMDDITAAIAHLDMFDLEGTAVDEDRGKQMWEISDKGASSYGSLAAAPADGFDVTITIAAEVGIVASSYVMEAWYTAGGN